MKSIVILYESTSEFGSEKVFGGKSAREITREWALGFAGDQNIVTLGGCENAATLLQHMADAAKTKDADYIIFSFDDVPFINASLTNQLVDQHVNYHAEYTFADGYPAGFSPEILDAGACAIMAKLAQSNLKEAGEKTVTRTVLYDFIKNDINSFEVETLIAPHDWRLLRLAFNAGTKRDFFSCKALFEAASAKSENPDELAALAAATENVLKTIPSFYSIQICNDYSSSIYNPMKCGNLKSDQKMSYEDFCSLVENISRFSDDAVISLSVTGEPFNHPDVLKFAEKVLSTPELSLFIETDGLKICPEFCNVLKNALESAPKSKINVYPKLMIAVQLDSATKDGYKKVRPDSNEGDFEKALQAITLLQNALPGCVYPQFVRMNENEDELENFFRFWNEKTSPTGGNFIIQKYDNMAGLLPERKPADLSPVERYVCWHLRRDMVILPDGSVPRCKACLFDAPLGNVLKEELETVWNKIEIKNIEKCGKCDEFYTFNF